jgi:hypothetical protein
MFVSVLSSLAKIDRFIPQTNKFSHLKRFFFAGRGLDVYHDPVSYPDGPQDAGGRGDRHQVQAAGPGHCRKQHHQLSGECVSREPLLKGKAQYG